MSTSRSCDWWPLDLDLQVSVYRTLKHFYLSSDETVVYLSWQTRSYCESVNSFWLLEQKLHSLNLAQIFSPTVFYLLWSDSTSFPVTVSDFNSELHHFYIVRKNICKIKQYIKTYFRQLRHTKSNIRPIYQTHSHFPLGIYCSVHDNMSINQIPQHSMLFWRILQGCQNLLTRTRTSIKRQSLFFRSLRN